MSLKFGRLAPSASVARTTFAAVLGVALGLAAPARALAQPPHATRSLGESLTGEAKKAFDGAVILFRDGDYAGALGKFRQAFAASNDTRLLWNMASCEKSLRHYAKTIDLLERYAKNPGTAEQDRKDALALIDTIKGFVASVDVAVSERGASVLVDSESVGVSPLDRAVLVDLGAHEVRVEKTGFKPFSTRREFEGGASATVRVTLQPEEHTGRLVVSAQTGDSIQLDGDPVGTTRWEGVVRSGDHAIRVTAPHAAPYAATVAVRDKETREVGVTLQRESGGSSTWLWVAGAAVLVAGAAVGGYFLFRPQDTQTPPTVGTIPPGTITVHGLGAGK
jgi:hypothetical protein